MTKIERKYRQYEEFHIVFDSYEEQSINNITRDKRLHGTSATMYKIFENSDIATVCMKNYFPTLALNWLQVLHLQHQLAEYLSKKLLEHARTWPQICVVAWKCDAASTHGDFSCLKITQEEADTKLILHSINACARGAKNF